MSARKVVQALFLLAATLCTFAAQAKEGFHLEEATIDSIQNGIRSGEVTCKQILSVPAPTMGPVPRWLPRMVRL
jgi:hypothetical protein